MPPTADSQEMSPLVSRRGGSTLNPMSHAQIQPWGSKSSPGGSNRALRPKIEASRNKNGTLEAQMQPWRQAAKRSRRGGGTLNPMPPTAGSQEMSPLVSRRGGSTLNPVSHVASPSSRQGRIKAAAPSSQLSLRVPTTMGTLAPALGLGDWFPPRFGKLRVP